MTIYVIKNNTTGQYVTRPGSLRSYTRSLEQARTFESREVAEADSCGNERVLSVADLLGRPY